MNKYIDKFRERHPGYYKLWYKAAKIGQKFTVKTTLKTFDPEHQKAWRKAYYLKRKDRINFLRRLARKRKK